MKVLSIKQPCTTFSR